MILKLEVLPNDEASLANSIPDLKQKLGIPYQY